MQVDKTFFKRTRRGKILHIVEDHYLRDDIGCGALAGKQLLQADLQQLGEESEYRHLLVLDTNVVLNQMDLLETPSPALTGLIILQTVLDEVRHINLSLYRRLRTLLTDEARVCIFFANDHHCETFAKQRAGETPNDFNDRKIRIAAKWFEGQLASTPVSVRLLTNDRLNRSAALQAGLQAESIHRYIHSAAVAGKYPALAELLAQDEDGVDQIEEEGEGFGIGTGGKARGASGTAAAAVGEANGEGSSSSGEQSRGAEEAEKEKSSVDKGGPGSASSRGSRQRKLLFPEHLHMSELTRGVKSGRLFQGTLRAERGSSSCYVVVQGMEQADERIAVYIRGQEHVNRAVDGDVVAVELLPRAQWRGVAVGDTAAGAGGGGGGGQGEKGEGAEGEQRKHGEQEEQEEQPLVPELTAAPAVEDAEGAAMLGNVKPAAKVVGIIRRNWRHYCGSLESAGDRETASGRGVTSCLFVPVDKKIPKVRIQTRQRAALSGKRLLVAIDSWPAWCRWPLGHYLQTLGNTGDKSIETEVILLEHDVPYEAFSGAVLRCLPPSDWQITDDNSRGREDLRHLPVLSIDPPGCKDIDDALHARPLENGNLEVGVHIADVTHFLEAGSAMDLEAASRSTSTYLVERRLDMLPGLLTETLCSLRGGVDRFAFSVLWEMTQAGEIVGVRFCKSIIHSIAAMTYGEAQMLLDDPKATCVKANAVRILNRIAKVFRKRRMDAGALTLASPEVRFVLDSESQNPTDVQMYALKETNALVEEFMLLANITVGKKILRHFPTLSILRRHPAPSRSQFEDLLSAAAAVGVELQVETSKQLAESLDAAQRKGDAYFNKLLRILCTRCMSPAQYFCSGDKPQPEWHHYGLATPIYTHFTSPIRRYADVMVHRLLGASIGVCPLPVELSDKATLHDLADNMNRRHRSAQLAGRASVGLHTVLYFKENPTEEDAYVLSVQEDRIGVLVPRFGIEGSVGLKELAARGLVRHEAQTHSMIVEAGGVNKAARVKLQVFDKVRVHLSVQAYGPGEAAEDQQHRAVTMELRDPVLPCFDLAAAVAPTEDGDVEMAEAADEAEAGPGAGVGAEGERRIAKSKEAPASSPAGRKKKRKKKK